VFRKDAGTTGRLEVNIQKGADGALKLAHSKANGQGYPNKDWAGFDQRVAAIIV
jgi:hypothetical protein